MATAQINRDGGLEDRRPIVAPVMAGLCVTSMLVLAALQYVMPPQSSPLGLNIPGAEHFRRIVAGRGIGSMDVGAFRFWFRAALAGAWLSYLASVAAGLRWCHAGRLRWAAPTVSATGLTLALLGPPSLSSDVYAYVANARVWVTYGENPYFVPPSQLAFSCDPTADFVGYVQNPCVYGSVWLQVSSVLVALLQHQGLWSQVVAMKLLGAASLLAAAWYGRILAGPSSPNRGDVALLAIGLNPLLLIEGPINGHNDLLMIALLMGAAALSAGGQPFRAALALGLSIGVKFVPLTALPWLVIEGTRGLGRLAALRRGALMVALALAPPVAGYAPFWKGPATIAAARQRLDWGRNVPDRVDPLIAQLRRVDLPTWVVGPATFAIRQYPVVLLYLAALAHVGLARGECRPSRWLDAWVVVSASLISWTLVVRYPWYLCWPLTVALIRPASKLSWLATAASIAASYQYTI